MRAWLKVIGIVGIAIALAVAALPLWIGPVLRIAGRPLHLRFAHYRTVGYSQFELSNVVYERGPVRVTVGWARVDTPVLWAWRHWTGSEGTMRAGDWRVAVSRSTTPRRTNEPVGFATLHDRLVKIASVLRRWVPNAQVEHGHVDWPTGGFGLANADWNHGTLMTRGLKWSAGSADVRAEFPTQGAIRVDAAEGDRGWRTQILWVGPTVTGKAWVWDQPMSIDGTYDRQGWLPVHAEAHALDWSVPAQRVATAVGNFYGKISGKGDAVWDHGHYAVRILAKSGSKSAAVPPLDIDVAADGDRTGFSVDALNVTAPYARIALNRPVHFRYGRRVRYAGTQLRFALDLQGIEHLQAAGRVAGTASLADGDGLLPIVAVELNVTGSGYLARSASDTGSGWLGKLAPGSVHVSARCDLQRRSVLQASVQAHWAADDLRRGLPEGMTAQTLDVTATASGPFDALRHEGQVHAEGFQFKPLLAGKVDLGWQGEGSRIGYFAVRALIGPTTIGASGTADRTAVRLTDLDFAPGGADALRLKRPLTVEFGGAFKLPAVELAGGRAVLSVSPMGSSVAVEMTRIPAAWIRSVVPWTGPDFIAQSVRFNGHWDQGRLAFSLDSEIDLWLSDGIARLVVHAGGDRKSLRLQDIRVESGGHVLASLHGQLPAWWQLRAPHVQWDVDAPIELRADTTANSPFWAALADSFGLKLTWPHAFLTASGTMNDPRGEFHLQVGSLAALPGRTTFKVPALQDVKLDLRANRDGIVLDNLSGQIAGRAVLASGRMPVEEGEWLQLFSRGRAHPWERAVAKLDVAEGDLSALAPFLPPLVAPRGRIGARFQLDHGRWSGAVALRGLQLRPLAPIGLIQAINGDLELHDRAIDIPSLSAEIGGQVARITGRVDLPARGEPQFVIGLQGNGIPLVRQANVLVRADLDLKASTVGRETHVTGAIKVVDGLMLGDLADLLPSGLEGGGRPPPYFSVLAAPFAQWHVDVGLVASHTLRAHTTLFNGDASARFQILGTLADPRAVGQLTIDEGQILLPFATFSVQFGAIRLQPDDPFHPRIEINATSRRYDYDLRLIASGVADSPVLTFSSNPALPSDQILQLVMAGQMPQTGSLIAGNESQVAGFGEYLGQGLIAGLSGGSGSSRLSISSGQELSLSGKPTYEIEYRLGSRWWITGEYDVFDDYNAGLKWRVYTKGGKP